MFNLAALSCRTFSLGRILIEYVFGAAIDIAYGDSDGGNEDGRDGARSAAEHQATCPRDAPRTDVVPTPSWPTLPLPTRQWPTR